MPGRAGRFHGLPRLSFLVGLRLGGDRPCESAWRRLNAAVMSGAQAKWRAGGIAGGSRRRRSGQPRRNRQIRRRLGSQRQVLPSSMSMASQARSPLRFRTTDHPGRPARPSGLYRSC